jgi:hypothetical protein
MRIIAIAAILTFGLASQAMGQSSPAPSGEAMAVTRSEIRELIEAAQATAKASRENVDYARVVPDLLYQILTKLDKIEDKLDRVETTLKASQAAAARKR